MAFDVDAAQAAGYNSSQIADFLGQQAGFDVNAARKAGYNDDQIVGFLAKDAAAPKSDSKPGLVDSMISKGADTLQHLASLVPFVGDRYAKPGVGSVFDDTPVPAMPGTGSDVNVDANRQARDNARATNAANGQALPDSVMYNKANVADAGSVADKQIADYRAKPQISVAKDIAQMVPAEAQRLGLSVKDLTLSMLGNAEYYAGANTDDIQDQIRSDKKTREGLYSPQTETGQITQGLMHMAPAVAVSFIPGVGEVLGPAMFAAQGGWDAGQAAADSGHDFQYSGLVAAKEALLNTAVGNALIGKGSQMLERVPVIGSVMNPVAADTASGVGVRALQGAATMGMFKPLGTAGSQMIDAATGNAAPADGYDFAPTMGDLITGALLSVPHSAVEFAQRNQMPAQQTLFADGTVGLGHKNGTVFSTPDAAQSFISANKLDGAIVTPLKDAGKPVGYVVQRPLDQISQALHEAVNGSDFTKDGIDTYVRMTLNPGVNAGDIPAELVSNKAQAAALAQMQDNSVQAHINEAHAREDLNNSIVSATDINSSQDAIAREQQATDQAAKAAADAALARATAKSSAVSEMLAVRPLAELPTEGKQNDGSTVSRLPVQGSEEAIAGGSGRAGGTGAEPGLPGAPIGDEAQGRGASDVQGLPGHADTQAAWDLVRKAHLSQASSPEERARLESEYPDVRFNTPDQATHDQRAPSWTISPIRWALIPQSWAFTKMTAQVLPMA